MARIARVVAPGYPHHITQRGNRRQQTFFAEDDYRAYIELMAEWCLRCEVEIWAYCLMPNHTHLIAVPESTESLRNAIGEAHRRYARMINFRENWRGYLWQGRFGSYVMDESYLLAAARYIELNPVRAKLVKHPSEYRWSSAQAHFNGEDDVLVKADPLLDLTGDWGKFLSEDPKGGEAVKIKKHERSGRPLGSEEFLLLIEALTGRNLQRRKPGPKGIRKMESHN